MHNIAVGCTNKWINRYQHIQISEEDCNDLKNKVQKLADKFRENEKIERVFLQHAEMEPIDDLIKKTTQMNSLKKPSHTRCYCLEHCDRGTQKVGKWRLYAFHIIFLTFLLYIVMQRRNVAVGDRNSEYFFLDSYDSPILCCLDNDYCADNEEKKQFEKWLDSND